MYDGIVNVYKEQGFTSHDVVAKLRGIYGQKKIGHTGTLDPMAEGVLIVCLGRATKLADVIMSGRKRYIATMRFGIVTDTDDITGNVIEARGIKDLVHDTSDKNKLKQNLEKRLGNIFEKYMGKTMQIPPMYSAIKVSGKKLYEYARAGIEIEREARPIEIYLLKLKDIYITEEAEAVTNLSELIIEASFEVECSKGTYIRSLIHDFGEDMGTGATMTMLLRDKANGFTAESGYKISDLQKLKDEDNLAESVLPMDDLLKDVPAVTIKDEAVKYLKNGNRLLLHNFTEGISDDIIRNARFIRIYHDNNLMALYSYNKSIGALEVYRMLWTQQ